jgi:hypothetical protein
MIFEYPPRNVVSGISQSTDSLWSSEPQEDIDIGQRISGTRAALFIQMPYEEVMFTFDVNWYQYINNYVWVALRQKKF